MPSRKASKNGFDYAANSNRASYPSGPSQLGYPTYPTAPAPVYPSYQYPDGYNGYMNGYGSGYTHAYGSEGYHQYMRNIDPSYDAFYNDGPTVDDKWKNTYPYVPTAYAYSADGHSTAQRKRKEKDKPEKTKKSKRLENFEDDQHRQNEEEDKENLEEHKRDQWGSQWEFIFSCIGLSVGLGNVWRFPYLAFQNGGGAFLIPYFILLIIIGKPMYFMEVALGQFSQLGPLSVWKMCPIGKGIGLAMCTISIIVAIYYNVLMGYCVHYIYNSFRWTLPWDTCDAYWADERCYVRTNNNSKCNAEKCVTAAEQYWERGVLGIDQAPIMIYKENFNDTSDQLIERQYALAEFGNIGQIKWDLCVSLLITWGLVFVCLSKGIKSSGKVVYFTATFPYLVLIILFVRGLFLEGAREGIEFFFIPTWDKLMDISVWRKAAEQVFFSLSVSWGGLIMFGSYNKFRLPVHIHAMAISSLDFITSILASVVIFSVLGHLKVKLELDDITEVIHQKQGLAFVAYPEAISLLPLPQIWSVLFFFMLLTLGLDSEFALLETALTGIYDTFPSTRKYKTWVCLVGCAACFLMSIPCLSLSGQYIFDLMDTYGGGLGVLWVAIFETIVLMWFYGFRRFSDDLRFMLNRKTSWFFQICWVIIPVILVAIFVLACISWTPPTYEDVHYPYWIHCVGWALTLIVAVQIPLVALFVLAKYAVKGQIKAAFQPQNSWGPGDEDVMDEWEVYQYRKNLQCKQHPYGLQGYENYGMQYPAYYNYGTSYQMY